MMDNNFAENDEWLDELIAWADEHEISNNVLPRDKAEIFALTSLNLNRTKLNELPTWVSLNKRHKRYRVKSQEI